MFGKKSRTIKELLRERDSWELSYKQAVEHIADLQEHINPHIESIEVQNRNLKLELNGRCIAIVELTSKCDALQRTLDKLTNKKKKR